MEEVELSCITQHDTFFDVDHREDVGLLWREGSPIVHLSDERGMYLQSLTKAP